MKNSEIEKKLIELQTLMYCKFNILEEKINHFEDENEKFEITSSSDKCRVFVDKKEDLKYEPILHEKVIFNGDKTILKIDDKKYSTVRRNEKFDKEKAVLMCIAKANGYKYSDIKKLIDNAHIPCRHRKYKFKIGDRVQFKSWEELKEEFYFDGMDIDMGYCFFTEGMKRLCGTYATILDIKNNNIVELTNFSGKAYFEWEYLTDMLKPASNKGII